MSTPRKPKAAATKGAEAHRQDDDNEDESTATMPDGAVRDRDGGGGIGGGGDRPGGAGGSLATRVFSNKKLVIGGLLLAGIVLFYLTQVRGESAAAKLERTTPEEDDTGPAVPDINAPAEDPLQADEQAFGWVFGGMAGTDATPPGEEQPQKGE